MKKINNIISINRISLISIIISLSFNTSANTQASKHTKGKLNENNSLIQLAKETNNDKLKIHLTNKRAQEKMTNDEILIYFKNHPEELEIILGELIKRKDAEKLTVLLPLYSKYSQLDMSIIEWGNAIINEKNKDYNKAIRIYRNINAKLPNVKLLQFHLANALYQNGEYDAAKFEFEKLRANDLLEGDKEMINIYLDKINNQNSWNFNGSLSYTFDPNINGVPPKGTELVFPQGIVKTKAKQQKATGVSYSFGADKRWSIADNYFTALHLNGNGSYYWDNKIYNDMTAEIGLGFGYSDANKEIEITPFYEKRLYAGVNRKNSNLDNYSRTIGVNFSGNYWFNENLKIQSNLRIGNEEYVNKYSHLDGGKYTLSNTILYLPNSSHYFYGGLDYSFIDKKQDDDSYSRIAMRAGWANTWGKTGLSTKLSLGIGKKEYKGPDFFGIKREETDYSLGVSVWHRAIHYGGITPRINWKYEKTDGNQPLYNYDKNNINLEFTKTF